MSKNINYIRNNGETLNLNSNLIMTNTESNIQNGSIYVAGSNSRLNPNIPLDQYNLQVDPNPIIIKKKPEGRVTLTQNVSLKFLKPPTPEQPGDITIRQEPDIQEPPLPPLHIIQKPERNNIETPEPLVYREKPPKPPSAIPPQVIHIPGKVVQRPRRVIVEQFAAKPPKPAPIIVERWLAYPKQTREVIFEQKPPPIYLDFSDLPEEAACNFQNQHQQVIEEVISHSSIDTIPIPLKASPTSSRQVYKSY
jgi:hypothetical protein